MSGHTNGYGTMVDVVARLAVLAAALPGLLGATTHASSDDCLEALSLAQRAGQVVMVAAYGERLDDTRRLVDEHGIGGIVLMTWPAGIDPAELLALKHDRAIPLLVATDEEGGDVQRLRVLGTLPSAAAAAASMSAEDVGRMTEGHATAVAELGVDVVLAPVVDVRPPGADGPIGARSFSDDPWVVAEYARATAAGWQRAGVLPVLKHFPGHGSADGDTHDGAAVTPPLDALDDRDLLPYTTFAEHTDHVGVMVGHLVVPGLTEAGAVPASLSPAAIDGLLRNDLGFADALVFTDALDMGAISAHFDTREAAVMALAAGADVVVTTDPAGTSVIVASITSAVGEGRLAAARLDEAVGRVLRAKEVTSCPASLS